MSAKSLTLLVLVASCGHDRPPSSMDSPNCADLSIAAAIGHQLREQVSAQYASADRAMTLVEAGQGSAGPDGASDERTGAGQRALTYHHAGLALCESARLVDAGMLEMARRGHLDSADVRAAANDMSTFNCALATSPRAANSQMRQSAQQEWSHAVSLANAAEGALVDACIRRVGAAPADIRLPPMVLINE